MDITYVACLCLHKSVAVERHATWKGRRLTRSTTLLSPVSTLLWPSCLEDMNVMRAKTVHICNCAYLEANERRPKRTVLTDV